MSDHPQFNDSLSTTQSSKSTLRENNEANQPQSNQLFDEIRNNLDSLNVSSGSLRPSHHHTSSFTSSISQYSGKVVNEPVHLAVNMEDVNKKNEEVQEGVEIRRGPSLVRADSLSHVVIVNRAGEEIKDEEDEIPLGALETIRSGEIKNDTPKLPTDQRSQRSDTSNQGQKTSYTPTSQYSDEFPRTGALKPDHSTHTNIEAPVPPRSSRRPMSGSLLPHEEEVLSKLLEGSGIDSRNVTPRKRKSGHSKKRSSLSVTDGLDELMRNANLMQQEQQERKQQERENAKQVAIPKEDVTSSGPRAFRSSSSSLRSIDSGNFKTPIDGNFPPVGSGHTSSANEPLHSEMSHDSFMTADYGGSGASTELVGLESPTPAGTGGGVSANPPAGTGGVSANSPGLSSTPTLKKSLLPPRPTPDNLRKAREVSQQYLLKSQELDDHGQTTPHHSPRPAHPQAPPQALPPIQPQPAAATPGLYSESSDHLYSTPGLASTPEVAPPLGGYRALETPPVGGRKTLETVGTTTRHSDNSLAADDTLQGTSQTHALSEASPEEDEYYDIEPPVVTKPARAKSVKQSTTSAAPQQQTKRKSKTTKKKSSSSRHATSGLLKPFSYQTLISLLESTNGTVIGEEFSQLDLPAKEKQLIEKIVDALSRLSADMVLDKDRYEVGISRMENALRVLEGFL